jgi:choline/carnitine/betaine transport
MRSGGFTAGDGTGSAQSDAEEQPPPAQAAEVVAAELVAAGDEGLPRESEADKPMPTDKVVFTTSAILALLFVLWGVISPATLADVASAILQKGVIPYGGWAFVLVASGFVLFAVTLAISRYGRIPLGKDGERPEFKTVSWVAMMFSAGMGIGLMFYGVAEPITFFMSPPPGTVAANTDAAVQTAMATALFHWTVHPWAIYAVVGLAIAYGTFRRGRSQLISAVFTPLLGRKRTDGPLGKAIDIMAIFATLFGSAASLGLGALQVGSGMNAVGWIDNPGIPLLLGIIAVLTVAFVASAVSGVAKGIQWLSNINMVLAAVLAFFVLVVGPTVLILNLIPTAVGDYFRDFALMAGRTGATGGEAMQEWLGSWTVFYWAWWISWTPFVGMFIARISRGRSIRQFILGVIAVPSVVSLVWFATFGGAAIDQQRRLGNFTPDDSSERMTFTFAEQFPLATLVSLLIMFLVAIFFVAGADAASVVMGTMSQRGTVYPKKNVTIFWGVATGAVAAVVLAAGGTAGGDSAGLEGLKNVTIIVSVPFVFVMIGLCVSLWKDLQSDPLMLREDEIRREVEKLYDERNGVRRKGLRWRHHQHAPTASTEAAPPGE